MNESSTDYDPRYLAGILFFNDKEFFEAHEAWEGLWMHCTGPERRFIQGLIQAAVALYHFGNGNVRGAAKLYRSARVYMEKYGSFYLGLDVEAFWRQMESCFTELFAAEGTDQRLPLRLNSIPIISLTPPPAIWPNPEEYVDEDD